MAEEVIPARQGRERQRYDEDGRRLVAGCVVRKGDKILMISSSRDSTKYIFPKGGWEQDESVEEAAVRETLEEAGVKVKLGKCFGWFDYPSSSASSSSCEDGQEKPLVARLCAFDAECLEEMSKWAENERSRQWMSYQDAYELCRHDYMRHIIRLSQECQRELGNEPSSCTSGGDPT